MANSTERSVFNIMGIFDGVDEYLSVGDPAIREWLLIKSNFWPFFLCSMYVLTVKVIGPAIMRDREPLELRKTMILYNMFLVCSYTVSITLVLYYLLKNDFMAICKDIDVRKSHHMYMVATCGWVIYVLKYVEFLDTIFFVLRKKDKLITQLHVIHHATLPIFGWCFLRTERSGFQAYPVAINSFVHIVMYSYYGIAAMGPSYRKYLWWKRYLTIAQMIQFILIILSVVVLMPLAGCEVRRTSIYLNIFGATMFFALFYNFYQHSFQPSKPQVKGTKKQEYGTKKEQNGTHKNIGNGDAHQNGHVGHHSEDIAINSQTKIKSN